MAARNYWLLKTEPSTYSIDDLAAEPDQTTYWEGVRNYQARNMLRDDFRKGDRALVYHSNAKPMAIVGTVRIVRAGYPDFTAWDQSDECHYDPKSDPDDPTWFMVDCKLIRRFAKPVTRDMLREDAVTAGMMVLARGSRLSVQPVTEEQWNAVHALAGVKPT